MNLQLDDVVTIDQLNENDPIVIHFDDEGDGYSPQWGRYRSVEKIDGLWWLSLQEGFTLVTTEIIRIWKMREIPWPR